MRLRGKAGNYDLYTQSHQVNGCRGWAGECASSWARRNMEHFGPAASRVLCCSCLSSIFCTHLCSAFQPSQFSCLWESMYSQAENIVHNVLQLCRGNIGANTILGDSRWGGTWGVDAEFVADVNCKARVAATGRGIVGNSSGLVRTW